MPETLPNPLEELHYSAEELHEMYKDEHEKYPTFYKRWGDPTDELQYGSYEDWLLHMKKRSGNKLKPIGYDLTKHRDQGIYVPMLDALDPYAGFPDFLFYGGIDIKMIRSLGAFAYLGLSNQLNKQEVSPGSEELLVDRLKANRRGDNEEGKRRNTLVISSHFTFHELGYIYAMLLRAEGGRPRADQTEEDGVGSAVLFNKIMASQSYMGKNLVDTFRPAGKVFYSYPKTASSVKFKVPPSTMLLGNALLMSVLNPQLEKGGMEMHAALTGSQIKEVRNERTNVLEGYEIPFIDKSSVRLIEKFDDIVDITLIKSPKNGRWMMKIGELLDINKEMETRSSADVVELVYRSIARSIHRITGMEVDASKIFEEPNYEQTESGLLIPK